MRFGEYIHRLREAKRMTLAHAARELGMTPQKLCDIEQGRRNFQKQPSIEKLQKFAAVYDHPLSNLITNTEFFQYEKSIINELIVEIEPVSAEMENKALEMLVEARQYTPEMESLACEAHALTQRLKTAIAVAKARCARGQARASDGLRLTRRAG